MVHSRAGNSNGFTWFEWVAKASGPEVYRILRNESRGVVHSVFNNSFNLVFGEKFVHIGSSENGISPFGIGLDQHDARNLTQQMVAGKTVTWVENSNHLIFSGGIKLSLKGILLINHSLHKSLYHFKVLNENFEYMCKTLCDEKWQTGLVQSNEDKKSIINYLLSNEPTILEIEKLVPLALGDESIDAESTFNYWIGRGPGLTPSGDDLFTGISAALSLLEEENQVFRKKLAAYLLEHGKKRTTEISLEYLLYATKNEYHSHLVTLCKLMIEPQSPKFITAFEKMGNLGHTSGTDTLIGILLGIKAVANK